jgi:hypothetical protein
LKRHRSISTGWEQPVDKEPAHRYVDSTARGGFGLTVQETSGGARETGSAPPSPECDLAVEGTSGAAERALLRGRAREAALQAGRPAQAGELRRRASRKQARWEARRARHVPRPRQARKRRTRTGGPARVASPAMRVTRIATTGARVDAGRGLPACRARLRPSAQGGVRGSESGTGPLIRGASAGASRKGRLHPVTASCEGNLRRARLFTEAKSDWGSVGSRSCSRIAHRMQTPESGCLGSSQEQVSRKRVR